MNSTPPRSHFTIGVLAQQSGVAIDTIRYYEREGLLSPAYRRASGYREYDTQSVERLRFILRAKELGFSLEEIRELLALESDRVNGVEGVKQRASRRLQELNVRIAQLTEMRDALARLIDACPGCGEPEGCPILSSIHGAPPEANDAAAAPSPAPASCCGADLKDRNHDS